MRIQTIKHMLSRFRQSRVHQMALRTTSIAGWVDVNRAARGSERRWQGTKRTQKSSKVVAAPRTGRCTHKGRNTQMATASNATRHQRSFSNAATRFGGKPFLFAKILPARPSLSLPVCVCRQSMAETTLNVFVASSQMSWATLRSAFHSGSTSTGEPPHEAHVRDTSCSLWKRLLHPSLSC